MSSSTGCGPARRRANRSLADLDLVIPVGVEITADEEAAVAAARRHARGYAFTIGAMGSKDQNFYNAAFTRQGYGEDVAAVQDLWLAGRREEAADRVPVELGARTNLIGTPAMITERLRLYRDAGITTLQAKLDGDQDQAARHPGAARRADGRGRPCLASLTGSGRGRPDATRISAVGMRIACGQQRQNTRMTHQSVIRLITLGDLRS